MNQVIRILCTVVSLLMHTSHLMAVDDDTYRNLDIVDLQDLIDFQDLVEEEYSRNNTDSLSSFSELCVPTDPIEDLEWFPSFHDDLISLKDALLLPPALSRDKRSRQEEFTSLNELGLVPAVPSRDKQSYVDFPVTAERKEDFISLNDMGLVPVAQSHNKQSYFDFPPVTPEQLEESRAKQTQKKMGKDVIEHGLPGSTLKRARMKNYYKPRKGVTWMKKKCTHCETDETPQWRNGPSGPKTLCNACGVRFKSGRLVPEYRPASSPTFDSTKHSNFHRKILINKHSLN